MSWRLALSDDCNSDERRICLDLDLAAGLSKRAIDDALLEMFVDTTRNVETAWWSYVGAKY